MSRKFSQAEIDLMYEQLSNDEDILWRGKPNIVPNLSIFTTILLVIFATIVITTLRYLQLERQNISWLSDWYFFTLLGFIVISIGYITFYSTNYYHKIKNVFYVLTNSRLSIFDSDIKRLVFSKRLTSVKVLRLKKTIFNSTSIIFHIDFTDDSINEIGFVNINDADKVYRLINQEMRHTKSN